jgi:predicted nucleotidyltransferase
MADADMLSKQYGLSDRSLETVKKLLSKYPGIQSAVLYGSRAKGNYKNGSDIDITLHTDDTFTHADLLHLMGDFDDSDLPYMVDVSDYRKLGNESLKEHIRRVGKVLYERQANIVDIPFITKSIRGCSKTSVLGQAHSIDIGKIS